MNRGAPRELLEILGSFRGLAGRKSRVEAWNAGLRFLPWGAGIGITPAILRTIGVPFIHPLFGLAAPGAAFLAGVIVSILRRGSADRRTLEIDRDLALKQALPTVLELARAEEGTENPFFLLLCRETARRMKDADPKTLYPFTRGRSFTRAAATFLLCLAVGGAASFVPDPRVKLTGIPGAILSEEGKRLAARADTDGEELAALGEQLLKLGEEMEGGRIDVLQAQEMIAELSDEVSKQIRDLKRNQVSSLLEEKRITPDQERMLSRMFDEELTPEEVRDLVLELALSPENRPGDREAMQKSFEEFMRNQQEGSQSLLADDLMDNLTDGPSEEKTGLESARRALDQASAELSEGEDLGQGKATAGSHGEREDAGEGSAEGGGFGKTLDDATEPGGAQASASGPPGKEEAPEGARGTFTPYEEEQPRADLPEGIVRDETKKGFLRVEPDEDFSLSTEGAREGEYGRVKEKPILMTEMPDSLRNIIQDYFAALGEEQP